ncbi:uncharacterized protein SOCEGT47_076520 [Sorangium cellulosum]|jgi:hypothetical protein|uniref:RiboL-PSP-HEPN domain-containing protein n=1 Tax=Sorangium cellulosum TaxID=56 RepID=A0A4P2QD56_SORCE|nr:hypothetical protein [Sorangium cellulosum]AUX27073.1 uncharacterized protein SOCEGT47_076520 [Sorangium cellulosum]
MSRAGERAHLNEERPSADDVMRWHDDVFVALGRLERSLGEAILAQSEVPEQFVGMSEEEVRRHFGDARDELEHVTCLQLLAAAEAVLRVDYLIRVYGKQKDPISKAFRALYKEKKRRVALDEDLLDLWREHEPASRTVIGDFRGALHYRNWLAHGRYWKPALARSNYDAQSLFEDLCALFRKLPGVSGWPGKLVRL